MSMTMNAIIGMMIPFIGTLAGAGCVFLMKDRIPSVLQKGLLGFASGVMIAAAVWSLLIPAIELSANLEKLSFIPAAVGFAIGIGFLYLMDKIIPHLHLNSSEPEGPKTDLQKNTMLVLAVTLHNIPEGMAVGVAFAGVLAGNSLITMSGAFVLAIGIAIQNFPEGAIISLPLASAGTKKGKAFFLGVLSGIVEPIAALLTLVLTSLVVTILPYLLSFAAGAMVYVVVEELIPESAQGKHSDAGTLGFAVGFLIMMSLDVALG